MAPRLLADNLDARTLVHAPVREALEKRLDAYATGYRRQREEYADARLDATTKLSGDEIVEKLQWTLDNMGVKRHTYQIQFHELFIRSCLPKIYEGEWEAHHDAILRRYALKRLAQETLIVCPRRFGKTWSVSMFCAAYAWCVPNSEVAIFSTGQRASGKLMALCLKFLSVLEGFQDRLHTKNVEKIVLKFSDTDLRSINCYPGSVKVRRAAAAASPCPGDVRVGAPPPRDARIRRTLPHTHTLMHTKVRPPHRRIESEKRYESMLYLLRLRYK